MSHVGSLRALRRSALFAGSACLAVACAAAIPAPAAAAGEEPDAVVARALRAVAELRLRLDPAPAPTRDTWLALPWRGRPSLEVKGRVVVDEAPGQLRDTAIVDLATGRVASFVWFPHASARKAGEPIISLSEVSSRADAHLRWLFPGADLALENVQRYRASGEEGVYYEASFAAPTSEIPFLEAPVRLLLDASTGNLFRIDVDPEWFAPPRMPAAHLTQKAAERIAAAALGSRDLAPVLGAGARLGKVAGGELFVVRPNDWLASPGEEAAAQARVAWVVQFSLAGDAGRTVHRLFVDAATGRILGGLPASR